MVELTFLLLIKIAIFMKLSSFKNKKCELLLLGLVFLVGFTVRLYKFNGPIADWHSWRQADTSAVSRNFVSGGFDLLHPRFDDLSNVPSGIYDNPQGYRFVEFPIYNVLQAGGYELFPRLTIEEWGRMVTIFSSLLSALFLYLIVKKRFGRLSGFFTLIFFLFLPFNIYYSRVVLPDPSMVTASLAAIYFFGKWLEENSKLNFLNLVYFLLSLVCMIAALLLSPYALFFTLPIIYLVFEKYGIGFIAKWQLWVFGILAIIPLAFWRIWMLWYPAGIPQSSWLFNSNGIRFKPAFFYWLFGERLSKLILGYFGVPLLILGILTKYKKELLFAFSFLLSSLIYMTVIATGNVQHDYYQILIIPSIAIFLGIGSAYLLSSFDTNKYLRFLVFLVCFIFTLFFGWYYIRDFYNIQNSSIVTAGQAVDRLTPKDAKVIALYDGDTTFLYQTKREGWASFEKDLPVMIKMGADYMVIANPTTADLGFSKTYKVVVETNEYVIFNLRQKP